MLVPAPALFHPKCTFADTLYILPTFVRSETVSREEVVSDDFCKKRQHRLSRQKKVVPLCHQCPDGGIGRRDGLKHRWGDPSRFEPGSGYCGGERYKSFPSVLLYYSVGYIALNVTLIYISACIIFRLMYIILLPYVSYFGVCVKIYQ